MKAGEKWSFSGASIDLPDVYDFQPSQAEPNPSADFNRTFSQLMIDLESCWTACASPNVAAMFQLQILGRDLIKRGSARSSGGMTEPPECVVANRAAFELAVGVMVRT
ncbi:hypothetical protein ACR6C2_04440 [Streptomyces sp. INA 01156]